MNHMFHIYLIRLLPSFLELAQKPVCESIECSFEKVIINSFPND